MLPTSAAQADAHGRTWSVSASPQLSVPTGMMAESFGLSPAGWVALGLRTRGAGGRLVVSYSGLRSEVVDHESTSHALGLSAELLLPRVLGVPRTYFIGGLGVLTRELTEGREIREEYDEPFPWYDIVRVEHDARVLDAVGRLGLGVEFLRGASWALSGECVYQASYSVVEPERLDLNLRVDESLRLGAVFRVDIN